MTKKKKLTPEQLSRIKSKAGKKGKKRLEELHHHSCLIALGNRKYTKFENDQSYN